MMRLSKRYFRVGLRTAVFLIALFVLTACSSLTNPIPTALPMAVPTTTPMPTATPNPPDHILFIGNSLTYYNLGVDVHLKELAASAEPPLAIETSSVVMSGARLAGLWNLGWTHTIIQEESWDVIVLQEYPQSVANDEQGFEKFYEITRKFDEEIRQAGAQPVLYMTWPRDEENPAITIEDIAQAHDHIGAELGIKVAPVGLAWQRAIQERPDLKLYQSDRIHPTAKGTYLATCVLYATVFGQSPVGLPYQPADMIANIDQLKWKWEQWQMTDDEVAFLQRIAWETVVDYQATP